MKLIKKALPVFVLLGLLFASSGCNGAKVEKLKVDEVKFYADTAAEKVFTAIDEENYDKFCEDFDDQMKAVLTKEKFKEIAGQLGKYESKEILAADEVDGYTRVYYKTRFSKSSKDVTFTVVFSKSGDKKISGLFYK